MTPGDPLRCEIGGWLHRAGADRLASERLPALKKAEKWLKDQGQKLRSERFAPHRDRGRQGVGGSSRVQSNIDLGRVELTGSATQRKVVLDVTVDGTEGTALGVMSQGELHALALSLFLPRGHPAREPLPVPGHRRPGAVDGPRPRRRAWRGRSTKPPAAGR